MQSNLNLPFGSAFLAQPFADGQAAEPSFSTAAATFQEN